MELIVTSGEREEKLEVEAEGAGTYLVHLGSRCYRVDTATTSSGLDSFLIRRSAGDSRAPDGNGPQEQWEVSVRRQAEGDYAVSSAGPLPATAVTVMDPLTHRAREALGASGEHAHDLAALTRLDVERERGREFRDRDVAARLRDHRVEGGDLDGHRGHAGGERPRVNEHSKRVREHLERRPPGVGGDDETAGGETRRNVEDDRPRAGLRRRIRARREPHEALVPRLEVGAGLDGRAANGGVQFEAVRAARQRRHVDRDLGGGAEPGAEV